MKSLAPFRRTDHTALVLRVLAIQWTAVLKSSSSLLQVFNGTRCPHVPHSTFKSCLLVALHLFDQGTLLRRLAPYCMYSTVMCTGTLRWYFFCKPSSVNKLWTSWGGRHRFCFCLPFLLYVDFEGDASSFSMLALFSFKLNSLLSLRLQLEYNLVKSNYNYCITMAVIIMWWHVSVLHTRYSIIYENTEPKFMNIFHAEITCILLSWSCDCWLCVSCSCYTLLVNG